MAYAKTISEIIKEAGSKRKVADKVAVLKENESQTLKSILALTYNADKEFYVPNTPPPYTPSTLTENHGQLMHEMRKLKYIIKGFSDPNIHKIKRERIFIEILEAIDKDDAAMLCDMIQKKPFKGLTPKTINQAFDGLIKEG